MKRRDFLKVVVVSGATAGLTACSTDDDSISTDPADVLRVFPQGVASGDPTANTVLCQTAFHIPSTHCADKPFAYSTRSVIALSFLVALQFLYDRL